MKSSISSIKSGSRVVIKAGRSRILTLFTWALSFIALLLLFLTKLNPFLLVLVASTQLFITYRLTRRQREFCSAISMKQGEDLLFKQNEESSWLSAEVQKSFISRWLIVLTIKSLPDMREHSFVIVRDSLDSQIYRQLVSYLLLSRMVSRGDSLS